MDAEIKKFAELNGIEVGDELGAGSSSRVYKASKNNTKLALKVIVKTGRESESKKLSYSREKSILKELNHPGIVKMIEVFDNSKVILFLFDLLDGDLQMLFEKEGLENRGVSLDKALNWFVQIVRAVEYLDEKGIYNRDLKLENILVEKETGNLKVCDFGSSCKKGNDIDELSSKELVGTRAYKSPEIIEGKAHNISAAEIWKLGVILYYFLT